MTLTVRSATVSGATTKGSALTHAELDENFNHLSQSSNHTFTPSGTAPSTGWASRTVAAKNSDIVSIKDAKVTGGTAVAGDGSQDDASGINAVLAASGITKVIAPAGTYMVGSKITVPAGVEFVMDHGAVIKPSVDMAAVVKVHAGGFFKGKVDVSAITFTGIAIDIDGVDNADSVPFRLHTKTGFDVILVGDNGSGTGTAVKLHADTNANDRVMGVHGRARVTGFEYGLYLRQTSTDLSKFVNANVLEIFSSDTLRPLYMESSHANGYGVDGNTIMVNSQPMSGTTVAACTISGQDNNYDLLPWDWDTVVGTAPSALVINAHARNSVIRWRTDRTYIDNNSTDDNLIFIIPSDDGAMHLSSLRSVRSDGIIKLLASTVEIPNNVFLKMLMSGGTSRSVMGFSTGDDLTITGANGAGDNIIYDVGNNTGLHALRINGTNKAFLSTNVGWQMQSARLQGAQGAAVAAANNLALGTDGSRFQISGATQINLLDNSSWQGGAIVTLHFQSTPTVKHDQAASGNNKPIMLAGAADFVASANDQLVLQYDSTDSKWYEISRTVI
jgi:hypothetical protein